MSIPALNAIKRCVASSEFADALGRLDAKHRPSATRAGFIAFLLADRYRESRGYVDDTAEQLSESLPFTVDRHDLQALHDVGVWVVVKRGGKGSPSRRAVGPLLLSFGGDEWAHLAATCGGQTPPDAPHLVGVDAHLVGVEGPSRGGQPPHSPVSTPISTPSTVNTTGSKSGDFGPSWIELIAHGVELSGSRHRLSRGALVGYARVLKSLEETEGGEIAARVLASAVDELRHSDAKPELVLDLELLDFYSPTDQHELRRIEAPDLWASVHWVDNGFGTPTLELLGSTERPLHARLSDETPSSAVVVPIERLRDSQRRTAACGGVA